MAAALTRLDLNRGSGQSLCPTLRLSIGARGDAFRLHREFVKGLHPEAVILMADVDAATWVRRLLSVLRVSAGSPAPTSCPDDLMLSRTRIVRQSQITVDVVESLQVEAE